MAATESKNESLSKETTIDKSLNNSRTPSKSLSQSRDKSPTPATPGPGKIYKYDYTDVHNDLEKNVFCGSYGGDNACYLAIAERKAKVDLSKYHGKRTKDEFYIPEMKELLDHSKTQQYWKRIVTFDPFGMTAKNPTIAATTAILHIPEFEKAVYAEDSNEDENEAKEDDNSDGEMDIVSDSKTHNEDVILNSNDDDIINQINNQINNINNKQSKSPKLKAKAQNENKKKPLQSPILHHMAIERDSSLKRAKSTSDGQFTYSSDMPPTKGANRIIVDDENGIHCIKAAIYYSWNIPALAQRLDLSDQELRNALYKYTGNPNILNPKIRTYLPSVGGVTVYIFGDPRLIRDKNSEIAVRVHDECNGSDVFGTDICTCRPYLIFALKICIEVAQRGGVGIIAYFRKEGRGLGEVTKYRVYNARRNQKGGDKAEKYFYQTESIAGIQDARFQTSCGS